MTSVIAIQGLVAALAGLLLLEARARREERRDCDALDAAQAAEFDFHPELIVAWDDEARYASGRPCTRPAAADHRGPRRPQLVGSHPHPRLR